MDEDKILKQLARLLDARRMAHSIAVRDTALKLAAIYGADTEKARIAGLVHDCAKCFSYQEMLELADSYRIELDEICMREKALIHGPLGARLAKEQLGITDEEILNAIDCHTTGRRGMTLLDRIIYLSDFIEPGRSYKGVEELRALAWDDLDMAVLKALDNTIVYVVSQGSVLHPRTVEARNELLIDMQ